MEKKIFYAPVNHPRCGDDLEHSWKYAVAPYRVTPHVWNVGGQDDVCAYLFDTGYWSSLYLLVDAIHSIGYDPRDIRKILLSHWHWDHVNGCAALQAMSGAEVWISREDEVFHQRFKQDTDPWPMVDYTATHFYDDNTPITQGRFTIRTTLTPGHTPGATSFRWEDTDEEAGKTYRCAMHGGLGVALMKREMLDRFGGKVEEAYRFISDCEEKLASWPVDIAVPSHLNQGNVLANIPQDRRDYSVWVADYAWRDCMLGRAKAAKELYPEVYGV